MRRQLYKYYNIITSITIFTQPHSGVGTTTMHNHFRDWPYNIYYFTQSLHRLVLLLYYNYYTSLHNLSIGRYLYYTTNISSLYTTSQQVGTTTSHLHNHSLIGTTFYPSLLRITPCKRHHYYNILPVSLTPLLYFFDK